MKPDNFELRTPHNFDRDANSNATALVCKDKSLAQQQFKDETDINVLFGRYLETGEMPQIDGLTYGDFTGIFNYQDAQQRVLDAQQAFSQLPAKVKNRFDNNPQKLIDFLNDPDNREEAILYGLVAKPDTLTPPPSGGPQGDPNAPGTASLPQGRTETPPRPAGASSDQTPPAGTQKP